MMAQEAAQEIIQDQTALDQAPQHIPVGLEPGEVIIEARRDGFCGWISKALVRKESAGKRAGGKRNEQGLLDTAQTRYGIPRVQWDCQRRARTFDDGGARFGENLAATMGTSTSSTTRRIPTGLSNDGGPPGPFSAGAYSTQAYSEPLSVARDMSGFGSARSVRFS